MTVPSTDPAAKLQAIADALALALTAVADVTVLSYDPIGAEIVGSTIAVGGMVADRTDIEEAEQRQGFVDWIQNWTVMLYVPLDAPDTAWPEARRCIGLMIASIDGQPQLGGEVQESKLVEHSLVPSDPEEGRRRQLVGTATVRVKCLMPDIDI